MPQLHSPKTLWELGIAAKNMTRIHRYMRWLHRHYQLDFNKYEELYQWSVEKPADFWQSIWQYFNVKSYSPYKQVLSDEAMPHARW